jgi:hypothetical protein
VPSRDQILSFHEAPPPPGESPWVVPPVPSAIEVVDYDPGWPAIAERVVDELRAALRQRALRIEHVGSTAVPGGLLVWRAAGGWGRPYPKGISETCQAGS